MNTYYEIFYTQNKIQRWISKDSLNWSLAILIFSLSGIWHIVYYSLLVELNQTGFLMALTNLYNREKFLPWARRKQVALIISSTEEFCVKEIQALKYVFLSNLAH